MSQAVSRLDPGTPWEFELGPYRMAAATTFGPRLIGLRCAGSPELLARLPDDLGIERPDSRPFRFRGGHRLWAGPEVPATTYAPDDEPCEVTRESGRVTITGPPDEAGFAKQISVTWDGDLLQVDHLLGNRGPAARRVAPWAVTQFPLGGTALLPLGAGAPADSYQADRRVIVWPYTSLQDDRIGWKRGAVALAARPGPRIKLGSGPRTRRLGYHRAGWLFVKEIPDADDARPYADLGAVGQVFSGEYFCELESLGPLVDLEPGASVAHRESWLVGPCANVDQAWALLGEVVT